MGGITDDGCRVIVFGSSTSSRVNFLWPGGFDKSLNFYKQL